MNTRLLLIIISTLWLISCRSTQVPTFFPPTQEYRPHLALPARSGPEILSRPALPTRAVALRKPEASASIYTPKTAVADTARRVGKKPKGNQPTQVVVGTDTLVGYSVNSRIPGAITPDTSAIRPDPETTLVNVVGGALLGTGLISLVVGAGSSGWGELYWALLALTLIPLGVILLIYQGKNSRLRLKREARRQVRAGTQLPAAAGEAPPSKEPKHNPLRKLAVGLLIAGGLLLIAGALTGPYGIFFFGLPGIITLLVGLIVVIAGL